MSDGGVGWLQEKLARSASHPAYSHYQHARDQVVAILLDAGDAQVSEYWREELAGFEYMLDASPLLIEKLRHHTFHVTGLHTYDYRTGKDKSRDAMAQKLASLLELGGRELLVPESPALGGFGHEIDGALYNVDTLKFYEVLIALERGGVLGAFREASERTVVWEIGAGWGGFAYAFKTLFPNVTYAIVDLPELFLFSATYLRTVFPDATVRFAVDDEDPFADWQETDFVLVPAHRLAQMRPPRIDLTINMVSFQEMITEQVTAYVDHAAAIGTPYLYSLNRDRSLYNRELTSVREIVARCFWLHEIPVLDVPYTKMPSKHDMARKGRKRVVRPEDNAYRHVVGWRRMPDDPLAADDRVTVPHQRS